jgi:lysophospholipase L1-like esterase
LHEGESRDMKKTLCILLAAILVFAAVGLQISAEGKYDRLLLLGDSITYGYGLEGTRDTCRSYGNLLGEYLGIRGENFKNAAVNGDTSADLLALLPSLAGDIGAADLIVITIGGNDLLAILWEAVAAVLGARPGNTELAVMLNNPEYIERLAQEITVQKITEAILGYTENLERIVGFIREKNPDGVAIFLAQYDPVSGAGFPEQVNSISGSAIMLLNAAMKETVTASDCVWLDIYSLFEGKGPEWTFIREGDIHPNATGHYMIFRHIVEYLESIPEPSETASGIAETTTTSDTAAAPETTTAPGTTAPADEKTQRRGCKASAGPGYAFACLFCATLAALRKKASPPGGDYRVR